MFLKNYSTQLLKNILIRFPKKIIRFMEYIGEFNRLKKNSNNRFKMQWKDAYPCLSDKTTYTPFDQHYTYHPAWAARILAKTKPSLHHDFSSIINFSTVLSAFIPVKFYDYRPAEIQLSNWSGHFANLEKLEIETASLESVSCMHTIEHIGLGRYGDTLDANGDIAAIHELQRITKTGGNILFVTPVGSQRIEFNAHRIYSYELVLEMFNQCTLKEFSLIPDTGGLIENAPIELVKNQQYGCGCFWFEKK